MVVETDGSQAKDVQDRPGMVYMPFKTFLSGIEALAQGLPDRVDKTVFPTFSGGNQTALMASLKALRLIDDSGVPQPALVNITGATGDAERRTAFADLLRDAYPDIVPLGEKNASPKTLDEALDAYGVTGDTRRKARIFYLQAAEYAGLPISRLWPKVKRVSNGKTKKRTAIQRNPRKDSVPPSHGRTSTKPLGQTPPSPNGTTLDVTLRSGGGNTMSLHLSLNVVTLSAEDREFVFDIIDRLRAYNAEARQS